MIARLRGKLLESHSEGMSARAVVDCGGVGYEVWMSLATAAPLVEGQEITLRIYTQANENRLALYAFVDASEQQLFNEIITVQNVGPRSALEILSSASSMVDLARMVAEGDTKGLTKLKGVGKKKADMLVAKLKDKCEMMLATWGAGGSVSVKKVEKPAASELSPLLTDVASALANLGWRSTEVDKVIRNLELPPDATVESVLRDAIRAMPR